MEGWNQAASAACSVAGFVSIVPSFTRAIQSLDDPLVSNLDEPPAVHAFSFPNWFRHHLFEEKKKR